MNSDPYFSDVKQLAKNLKKDAKSKTSLLSWVERGILKSLCCLGHPIWTIQFNPNFRIKYFLGTIPLLTCFRKPNQSFDLEALSQDEHQASRIYINVASLPYFDNRSGIPRVAKELTKHGMLHENIEVLPVYCEPREGVYRIARHWARQQGYDSRKFTDLEGDPLATFKEGDWLIHTMINEGEIAFNAPFFKVIRQKGVKVGFVLHDIIAERSPHFFRRRDAKHFSQWLNQIHLYDGIFAISQATLNDYKDWFKQHYPSKQLPLCGVFHLGADFSTQHKQISTQEAESLKPLEGSQFYLQVSTIEPRKGYQQLVAGFDCLWAEGFKGKLVLVGRKGWMMNSFCRRIRQHKEFGKRLFWFDNASDAVVQWLYTHCRGVVFASENEGFGLSCVEGAYFKKPVLVRDLPVFHEIAGNHAFYFKGKAPKDIACAIMRIEEALFLGYKQKQISVLSWKESTQHFFNLLVCRRGGV